MFCPFIGNNYLHFPFFGRNIVFYLSIHDIQSLVIMINVSTNQLNQQFISCLAMSIYQHNLAF